jgi:hypothetical protein
MERKGNYKSDFLFAGFPYSFDPLSTLKETGNLREQHSCVPICVASVAVLSLVAAKTFGLHIGICIFS